MILMCKCTVQSLTVSATGVSRLCPALSLACSMHNHCIAVLLALSWLSLATSSFTRLMPFIIMTC